MEKTKEEYVKEQREKVKELNESIKSLVDSYHENPENLIEMAQFQSRFYQYSYHNNLLILSQNRGATFVGSYEFFKKQNYPVKRGEKGIKILVPIFTKCFKVGQEEKTVKNATKEEKERIKKGQIKIYEKLSHFRIGNVFDIAQTTCPPEEYPKFFHVGYSSQEHEIVYKGLKTFSEQYHHCPVSEEDVSSIALRGYYMPIEHRIVISELLKDTEKVSTLSHEIGHALIHNLKQNQEKIQVQKELEADIMSLMVQTHLGLEITEGRKRHLTEGYKKYEELWKEQEEKRGENSSEKAQLNPIEDIMNDVRKEYQKNIEKLDKCIEEKREEKEQQKIEEQRKKAEEKQHQDKECFIEAAAAGVVLYGMNQEYLVFQDKKQNLIIGQRKYWDADKTRYDNRSRSALVYPGQGCLIPVLEKNDYEYAKKYGYLDGEIDVLRSLEEKIEPTAKVTIYQVKADKREYLFRDRLELQRAGLDIREENYKLVAEFNLPKEQKSIHRQLETIFQMGNTGKLQAKALSNQMRSISVSDIIRIDQEAYYVESIGFSEINLSQGKEMPAEKMKVARLLEEKDVILHHPEKLQEGGLLQYFSQLPEKKLLLESLEAFKKEEPAMARKERLELPQLHSKMPQIREFIKEMEENPGMIEKANLGAIMIGTGYGTISPVIKKSREKMLQKSKGKIFQKGIEI